MPTIAKALHYKYLNAIAPELVGGKSDDTAYEDQRLITRFRAHWLLGQVDHVLILMGTVGRQCYAMAVLEQLGPILEQIY